LSLADSLVVKVRAAVAELVGGNATCLAAVSGGPDSVAMVVCLAELAPEFNLELGVAHLDHGIREAAAADAEWVAELAERLQLPCFADRVDCPALKAAQKLTLEEAARRARYSFLERAGREWGATFVAAGHTADDQAETVLFRIIRGTGLSGLAGIPRSRPISDESPHVQLVRPLLDCRREEVLTYLDSRGHDYLTDETNFDTRGQARARIRHELLPRLEAEHNPEIRSALVRLARRAGEVNELVQLAAHERIGEQYGQLPVGREEIPVPLELLAEPRAVCVEVLRLVVGHMTGRMLLDRARLAEAARELPGAGVGKQYDLGEVVAVRDYHQVLLRSKDAAPAPPPAGWLVDVRLPGETRLPVGELVAEQLLPEELDMAEFSLTKTAYEEVLDSRLLHSGARPVCRTRRPGDRFHPLGAAGERKLKDFFIDEKVPQARRDSVPLLVLGDEILWVVGHRLSEAARVTPDARELIRLKFLPRD
jgi:tRNA(Ile)-lysidine synthase